MGILDSGEADEEKVGLLMAGHAITDTRQTVGGGY